MMRTVFSAKESSNISIVQPSGFYLVGFTNLKNSEYLLVFLFLVYVITLLGNFTLMAVVCLQPQLHTPRYMAVFNLAVADVVYNTTLIPKALLAFLFNSNFIGFDACFTQMFFALYAVIMESLSLLIMAYDRFVAICFPLQYPSVNTSTKMFIILSLIYSYKIRTLSIALASTLPPMLNPIIYSLNTEEVQSFISRAFKKWNIFPLQKGSS
nr:PREDICTED: olfactory receptor 145-like [Latimeria chalumnae]|eukprot:XP_014353393.1 PREDICTED: olfactory receptor 145-like [Latimeria chalumnae]